MQTFQPLLKENREYFLAPKVLTRAPKARDCRGSGGLGVLKVRVRVKNKQKLKVNHFRGIR